MTNGKMSIETVNTGSNYDFGDKLIIANTPKSFFDLSKTSTMDIDNAGIVIPICKPIKTVPTDEFEISVESLIRVLPQTVPLYSTQRLYIYAFYSRMGDLWENWNAFARRGPTGKYAGRIPTLHDDDTTDNKEMNFDPNNTTVETGSLADYMGMPIGLKIEHSSTGWNDKISALPFMMYLRIWRDYFINKNQYVNNDVIFPMNDDDFRLNDDGVLISAKKQNKRTYFNITDKEQRIEADQTQKSDIKIGLFYHNWPDDRFTDALPWPQRGEEPTIEFDANKIVMNGTNPSTGEKITLADEIVFNSSNSMVGFPYGSFAHASQTGISTNGALTPLYNNSQTNYQDMIDTRARLETDSQIRLTTELIRELAIGQIETEKLARTDGTYLGFALTFFAEKPKNALDYKPVFIGGTVTTLQFTEVLQTNNNENTTPLGSYAGHGIGYNGNGYIGKIHCDDYGYIMLLACIMPDVYYAQGLHKDFTTLLQSEMYLPERARLGLQPILEHEIYALGTEEQNQQLFAYNNPFDEMRYEANEIHGKIADITNESFRPYTQARIMTTPPNWGKDFSEAKDVRKDYLAVPEESAYTAQFKINIRGTRPLPYKAMPAQVIN